MGSRRVGQCQIKRDQFKYKLEEAGLSDTGRHRYKNQRRQFFIRNSYRLPHQQGSALILEHKIDSARTIYLADDPGYMAATAISRATSHDGDFEQ